MTGKDKTGRDDDLFDIGMDSESEDSELVAYDGSEILPESPTIRGNKRSRQQNIYGSEAQFSGFLIHKATPTGGEHTQCIVPVPLVNRS